MADTQPDIPPQQDFGSKGIQDFIGQYLPYWPIFVVLMGIGAGIAYAKLRREVPVYQAAASLIIKEDEQQNSILKQLSGTNGGRNLENEMAVLKSKPVAAEIVRALHLYAPIIQEGRLRKVQSAYSTSPVVFRVPEPDSIKGVDHVPFTYNQATRTVSFGGRAYPLNQYVSTPYGRMMILSNSYYNGIPNGLPKFFSLVPLSGMAGMVQGSIGVAPAGEATSILNLSYNDQSPERAIDILNQLVVVYNRATINDKNQMAANTLRFLDIRLDSVEQDLDSIEIKQQNYLSSNRIVDLSAQGGGYLQRLNANDQQLAELNIQLGVLNQVERYISSKEGNKDALVPAIGTLNDPILSGQLQRLYTAESEQARLAATTGKDFPTLAAVRSEIDNLRPTLLENIRNQRRNLTTTQADLNAQNGRFNSLISALPAKERDLLNIDRQQKIKNTIYTFLLQRREETALTVAATVSDSRLVNDAGVAGIVSPQVQNTYIQWIAAAFALGVLFVFIRENLNRNIKSRQEVEKLTPAPIVAEIAHSPTKDAIVVETGSRSMIAEQFRYLRTALNYLGINATHRKILFTSSISGEGKSFITMNLGATLALTGKSVVVLEMDLRKPKLSEMLGIDRNLGLSDYFIGAKSLTEVIKPTPVSNLYLISSGTIPPNPAELLANTRLEELLQQLEIRYDYVLIDTAPVSPVTDAYIISPLCDVTLYVVRQGRTPRFFLQKLNETLRTKRLKNLSIVLNGVRHKRFGSYYGYGYGYTYGYGYLDDKGGKKKKKK